MKVNYMLKSKMNKKIICLLAIMSIATIANAQKVKLPKNDVKLPKGFIESITQEDLKKHLFYIAGPETEGRGTGTPGLAKAASYIENHFIQLGLLPSNGSNYQQTYELFQDSVYDSKIKIGNKTFEHHEEFGGTNRSNKSENLNISEFVYLGYGVADSAYNDYKDIDVKNKIVVVSDGEPKSNDTTYLISGNKKRSPWSWNLELKLAAAAKNGASALFIIDTEKSNRSWTANAGGIYPAHLLKPKTINRYMISNNVVRAIFGTIDLSKGKTAKKTTTINFNILQLKNSAANVAGILPGTDKKDEFIVLTAHMDHLGKDGNTIYYGADDDGSGTCAILELAEAFVKAKNEGKSPRRSIVFMTVSGEEKGLWGSKYYTMNPLFPLEKTSVDLNIDMIGRTGYDYVNDAKDSTNYVYVIGDDKLSTDLRPINELANKLSSNLKLDYRYNDPNDPNRFYFRSDHYNFAEKGVPIIFYFDGEHKDYHQPSDTPDKINYTLYSRRARLVAATAWIMANKNEMLKRDLKLESGGDD
jgi:Peptidase family M28